MVSDVLGVRRKITQIFPHPSPREASILFDSPTQLQPVELAKAHSRKKIHSYPLARVMFAENACAPTTRPESLEPRARHHTRIPGALLDTTVNMDPCEARREIVADLSDLCPGHSLGGSTSMEAVLATVQGYLAHKKTASY